MNKSDVIAFFDRCAPRWDADMIKNDAVIEAILDNAEVGPGMEILDVACGTGVMIPYYLKRDVSAVTGIDISPEMARIAGEKFAGEDRVTILCGDVEMTGFDRKFDRIVVYNAFPHFPDPKNLIRVLAGLLKEGGRLTIAHGASRESIDGHHKGAASAISNGLMRADSLKRLFDAHLEVEIMISNSRMYQVSGVKQDLSVHSHGGITHSHAGDADHSHADAPMEELVALMKFTVAHNEAHAQELADLAQRLEDAGNRSACRRIMEAVADFDVGNATLSAVLDDLTDL